MKRRLSLLLLIIIIVLIVMALSYIYFLNQSALPNKLTQPKEQQDLGNYVVNLITQHFHDLGF